MKFQKYVRKGFTLVEVLVTLAILAIMAGVLFPALNQQISKGDSGRLAQDLENIQAASQAFVSDVHRFPGSTSQLTTSVAGSDALSSTISALLQAKWKGPYVSRDSINATGSGGTISPTFTVTTFSGLKYLTATVNSIGATEFANIEAILDEGSNPATSSTAGQIRYNAPSSTLTFLILPIQ